MVGPHLFGGQAEVVQAGRGIAGVGDEFHQQHAFQADIRRRHVHACGIHRMNPQPIPSKAMRNTAL
jgi:hypothetical protein